MARVGIVVATVLALGAALYLLDTGGSRARSNRDRVVSKSGGAGEHRSEDVEPESRAAKKSTPENAAPVRRRKANAIEGRVVDRDGVPIPDARVSITEFLDPFAPEAVSTDADGRFSVPCRPNAPARVTFQVRHPQFVPLENVQRETGPELQFVLKRGLPIHGHVRFPDGTPLRGIAVEGRPFALSENTAAGDVIRASADPGAVRTDGAGAFLLGGFEPGMVVLQCEGIFGSVVADAGASNVELVARRSVVRVTVVDENGSALPRAAYSARVGGNGHQQSIGKSGTIAFPILPGVAGWVVASCEGYLSAHLSIAPRDENPRLHEFRAVLRPVPDTRLDIVVSTPHAPKAAPQHAFLYWLDESGHAILRSERLQLRDGRADIHGLPTGSVLLNVWVDGPEAGALKTVVVQSGAGNKAEFAMPPSASVRVLLDKANRFRILVLETLEGRRLGTTFSCWNGEGIWTSDRPIAEGRYRLMELGAKGVVRMAEIHVSRGATDLIDWRD